MMGQAKARKSLTVTFEPRYVTIAGSAPRGIAHEVCFALAEVFKRHGLGTNISVSAAMTDEEIVQAAADVVRSAAADGMSNEEIAEMVLAISSGIPPEVAPKHAHAKVVATRIHGDGDGTAVQPVKMQRPIGRG